MQKQTNSELECPSCGDSLFVSAYNDGKFVIHETPICEGWHNRILTQTDESKLKILAYDKVFCPDGNVCEVLASLLDIKRLLTKTPKTDSIHTMKSDCCREHRARNEQLTTPHLVKYRVSFEDGREFPIAVTLPLSFFLDALDKPVRIANAKEFLSRISASCTSRVILDAFSPNGLPEAPYRPRTVEFVYTGGSHGINWRKINVSKEDGNYIEGVESDTGEYKKFLKSKIVGGKILEVK